MAGAGGGFIAAITIYHLGSVLPQFIWHAKSKKMADVVGAETSPQNLSAAAVAAPNALLIESVIRLFNRSLLNPA